MSGLTKIHICLSCGNLKSKNAFGLYGYNNGNNFIYAYSDFCGDCRRLELKGKLSFLPKLKKQRKQHSKFVYIISELGSERYKIGMAKDVDKRLLSLQTANSSVLKVIYKSYQHNALLVESDMHYKFVDKKVRGEWFNLNVCDLYNVIKSINSSK